MGNRSDGRFANLANPLALEAVVPIRTRRADSIMARSQSQSSSQRPYIRMQPFHLDRSSGLRPGLGPYTKVRGYLARLALTRRSKALGTNPGAFSFSRLAVTQLT